MVTRRFAASVGSSGNNGWLSALPDTENTWEVGKPVARHVHDRDSVQVFFAGGTIRFTDANGKVETKTFKFKDARFIPRGTVDTEEAIAGSPRAVTIEMK